ncbi:MAG: dienelactone hydrolase family protein [Deltaproteobacteria bacterium]|jgi:dienelactone hydrolase|nr:dienelactone hydrolase family protein [Deltaproteobacteria bacterium]
MSRLSILLAIALFVSPITAQSELIEYQIDQQTYEGYYVSPSPSAPLVMLFHDWDGLTDYEIKRAEMLAKEGFAVFAADLFGKGVRPTEVKDKRQHTGELYEDRQKMQQLMLGAIAVAAKSGGQTSNAVAMGYCFGGAAVLELARSGTDFKGFATFHGGLKTPEGQSYAEAKGQILVMHGTADSAITMTEFADLAVELEQNNVPHEMITYGGAPHAFTVFGAERYRADADRKSWQRFLDFLNDALR